MTLDQVLMIALSLIGALGLIIFKGISEELKKLSTSVETLNIQIAVVITRVENHDERIKKLECRD